MAFGTPGLHPERTVLILIVPARVLGSCEIGVQNMYRMMMMMCVCVCVCVRACMHACVCVHVCVCVV